MAFVVDTQSNEIRCELYIPDDKELFRELEEYKSEIANELNCELEWMYLEGKKASRIRTVKNGDITQNEKWNQYFEWLINKAENFQEVFKKYV